MIRIDNPDFIYKNEKAKFNAVISEIEALHKKGQPVLVGTISIVKSETLSSMLKKKGIKHSVLNAKYHEMEAEIVGQAGRYAAAKPTCPNCASATLATCISTFTCLVTCSRRVPTLKNAKLRELVKSLPSLDKMRDSSSAKK